MSATSLTTPEASPFLEPLEVADGLELLRRPAEGIDNEDSEIDVPAGLISDGPPPGIELTILAGICHFAAYPTRRKDTNV